MYQQYFCLSLDIIDNNCEFKFCFSRIPKAVILDVGDTLLLSSLNKLWYLHCNEHNNVPISTSAYDYTVMNRSLLCNYQLQGGIEFLHKSLGSSPSTNKVDRNMNFTINMVSTYQLQMNFPEVIHTEDFNG